ncbi:MAG: ATP-dependent dethiobiotin synthetase BioD [Gomphosphaeria aponina SAG 52.96 = DSM 107014]|uniref:ATP-dependent dethiobiotin synthetase BioD n=1 Tax=Gomphosphaeria aponina SAG 52.96 = DSM 107014 TaxID=1521640 RepID=A0A941GTI8_9CHRO|nr:ATP-dependent dethiobiotin synthetase BioD [Gomphosphaeria aponina SAG 52.96 = DSM 107014]
MKSKALLITGTDTGSGKTVLTSALAAYYRTYHSGKSLGLMKLIQTGIGDRELYQELFGEVTVPLCFDAPVAPPIAAQKEGRTIELEKVWQAFTSLNQDLVLVEALGGLGSPVTKELTVADIAAAWRLNTVLVVPVKLGAIAAAVANVALARQSGVKLQGIILNCVNSDSEQHYQDWTPVALIQSLTQMPVLGKIPPLPDPTNLEKLAQVASSFDLELLI